MGWNGRWTIGGTVLVAALPLAGCGGKGADSGFLGGGGSLDDSSGGGDSGGAGDGGAADSGDTGELPPLQQACATGEDGETTQVEGIRLSAEVTWSLSFDEEAAAAGYADCAYSRTFEGEQVLDSDFLCPECDLIVRGTAVMTEGADCYEAVFGSVEEERVEWWGVGADGTLYRTGRDQGRLGDLTVLETLSGDGTSVPVGWDSTYDLDSGGTMTLAATGTLAWWTDPDLLLDDPWAPRAEPYACGWECEDPGDLELDYTLAVGDVVPNVRLRDACGEQVDLWDFYGSWLVLDSSQSDCGPCRSMAEAEPEFVNRMRAQGIPVRVITLMGNGISDSWSTPSEELVAEWIDTYGLTDPVLADRGYATALFPDFIEATTGESYGFPVWLIVDPEMRLVMGNVGYSSWDAMEAVILDGVEARRRR